MTFFAQRPPSLLARATATPARDPIMTDIADPAEERQPYLEAVQHPSAWRSCDADLHEAITWQLDSTEASALRELALALNAAAEPIESLAEENINLGPLEARLEEAKQEVIHGRGLALIRGLPVAGLTVSAIEKLYSVIGSRMGTAVSQSVMGDRIGHVTDVSGKDPNERAYRNSLELPLHTDISDIVGMLCIRPAMRGGESLYASVAAVHNALLAARPELLRPLYRGYRMHLFGEQSPGAPPVTEHNVPVLSERDGLVSARIVPEYIDMAEVELGQPMDPLDREAINQFLAIASSPEHCLRLTLKAGDMTFINNYGLLHARTLFDDFAEPEQRRLLLRLWLKGHECRAIDESAMDARRDGIAPQAHRHTTYFTGETARQANRGRYGETPASEAR
jgi:hypothetical protein